MAPDAPSTLTCPMILKAAGLCYSQFLTPHCTPLIHIITGLPISEGNDCHERTGQKNTVFWAENSGGKKKSHLSQISHSYKQRPYKSSWTFPSPQKSHERKELGAEEREETKNTINFRKLVKLHITTSKKNKKIHHPGRK